MIDVDRDLYDDEEDDFYSYVEAGDEVDYDDEPSFPFEIDESDIDEEEVVIPQVNNIEENKVVSLEIEDDEDSVDSSVTVESRSTVSDNSNSNNNL